MTDNQRRYIITEEDPEAEKPPQDTVYVTVGSPYLEHAEEMWELPMCHDLEHYSDEFAWGANNERAAQLALAILAELYDDETALEYHQDLAERVIAYEDKSERLYFSERYLDSVVKQIIHPTVNRIVAADKSDLESEEFAEFTEKELAIVEAAESHIWYEGTYYIGDGTAEEVHIGDMYYYRRGLSGDMPPVVTEVVDIIESDDGKEAVFDTGWEIHIGFILGEPMTRAQLPPPKLLKEQHSY